MADDDDDDVKGKLKIESIFSISLQSKKKVKRVLSNIGEMAEKAIFGE